MTHKEAFQQKTEYADLSKQLDFLQRVAEWEQFLQKNHPKRSEGTIGDVLFNGTNDQDYRNSPTSRYLTDSHFHAREVAIAIYDIDTLRNKKEYQDAPEAETKGLKLLAMRVDNQVMGVEITPNEAIVLNQILANTLSFPQIKMSELPELQIENSAERQRVINLAKKIYLGFLQKLKRLSFSIHEPAFEMDGVWQTAKVSVDEAIRLCHDGVLALPIPVGGLPEYFTKVRWVLANRKKIFEKSGEIARKLRRAGMTSESGRSIRGVYTDFSFRRKKQGLLRRSDWENVPVVEQKTLPEDDLDLGASVIELNEHRFGIQVLLREDKNKKDTSGYAVLFHFKNHQQKPPGIVTLTIAIGQNGVYDSSRSFFVENPVLPVEFFDQPTLTLETLKARHVRFTEDNVRAPERWINPLSDLADHNPDGLLNYLVSLLVKALRTLEGDISAERRELLLDTLGRIVRGK